MPVGKCVRGEKHRSINTVILQPRLFSSAFLPATLLLRLLLFCRGSLLPYSVPCFPLFFVSLQGFLIPSPLFAYLPSSPELPFPSKLQSTPSTYPAVFCLGPFWIPRSSLFVQITGVILQASASSPVPNPVFNLFSFMLYTKVSPLMPALVQCFCLCKARVLEQCITIKKV